MNQGTSLHDSDADKLAKVITTGYEKAHSYSRVLVGLGYAALLTVWSGTRQVMSQRRMLASALLALVSILAYIFFEIFQMVFNAWTAWRFSRNAAAKGLQFALFEHEKTALQWQPRIYMAWLVALLIALPTGLSSAGVLLYSFVCRLLQP